MPSCPDGRPRPAKKMVNEPEGIQDVKLDNPGWPGGSESSRPQEAVNSFNPKNSEKNGFVSEDGGQDNPAFEADTILANGQSKPCPNYLTNGNLNGSILNIPPDAVLNGHSGRLRKARKDAANKLAEVPPMKDKVVVLEMSNGHKDEAIGPANTHKKFLRGEKLYLTEKKQGDCSARKFLLAGALCILIFAAVLVGVLAATGILSPDASSPPGMPLPASVSLVRPTTPALPARWTRGWTDTLLTVAPISINLVPKDLCKVRNGGCQDICIWNPHRSERTCACTQGTYLANDNTSCSSESTSSSSPIETRPYELPTSPEIRNEIGDSTVSSLEPLTYKNVLGTQTTSDVSTQDTNGPLPLWTDLTLPQSTILTTASSLQFETKKNTLKVESFLTTETTPSIFEQFTLSTTVRETSETPSVLTTFSDSTQEVVTTELSSSNSTSKLEVPNTLKAEDDTTVPFVRSTNYPSTETPTEMTTSGNTRSVRNLGQTTKFVLDSTITTKNVTETTVYEDDVTGDEVVNAHTETVEENTTGITTPVIYSATTTIETVTEAGNLFSTTVETTLNTKEANTIRDQGYGENSTTMTTEQFGIRNTTVRDVIDDNTSVTIDNNSFTKWIEEPATSTQLIDTTTESKELVITTTSATTLMPHEITLTEIPEEYYPTEIPVTTLAPTQDTTVLGTTTVLSVQSTLIVNHSSTEYPTKLPEINETGVTGDAETVTNQIIATLNETTISSDEGNETISMTTENIIPTENDFNTTRHNNLTGTESEVTNLTTEDNSTVTVTDLETNSFNTQTENSLKMTTSSMESNSSFDFNDTVAFPITENENISSATSVSFFNNDTEAATELNIFESNVTLFTVTAAQDVSYADTDGNVTETAITNGTTLSSLFDTENYPAGATETETNSTDVTTENIETTTNNVLTTTSENSEGSETNSTDLDIGSNINSTVYNFTEQYLNGTDDLSNQTLDFNVTAQGRLLDPNTWGPGLNDSFTNIEGLLNNGTFPYEMWLDSNNTMDNETEPPLMNVHGHTCQPDEFICWNECRPLTEKCDGIQNCQDGSDEAECSESCGTNFKCGNRCIQARLRCDGMVDCEDHSDETGCGGKEYCDRIQQVSCSDDSYCIKPVQICDNVYNCLDKSDERDCVDRSTCQSSGRFFCDDGLCLPPGLRCDGSPDCKKGEDEEHCGACSHDEFACPDGSCHNSNERCDGIAHCTDGSDEMECVRVDTNGVVQLYHSGNWSLLCAGQQWDQEAGNALCRELGYSSARNVSSLLVSSNSSLWGEWIAPSGNPYSYWIAGVQYNESCTEGTLAAAVICEKYDCGNTPQEQWPFAASVRDTSNHVCRAEIITPLWLVTSVSCLGQLSGKPGEWKAKVDRMEGAVLMHDQERAVDSVVQHPHSSAFRSRLLRDFDVGLVRLKNALNFERLSALCLPAAEVNPGITCFTSTLHAEGPVTFLPLTVHERTKCNEDEHYNGSVGSRMLCTDSDKLCHSDEAAPLACVSINSRWYLAGLLSYQRHCGAYKKHPAVYANVYAMRPYIEKVLGMRMYNVTPDVTLYEELRDEAFIDARTTVLPSFSDNSTVMPFDGFYNESSFINETTTADNLLNITLPMEEVTRTATDEAVNETESVINLDGDDNVTIAIDNRTEVTTESANVTSLESELLGTTEEQHWTRVKNLTGSDSNLTHVSLIESQSADEERGAIAAALVVNVTTKEQEQDLTTVTESLFETFSIENSTDAITEFIANASKDETTLSQYLTTQDPNLHHPEPMTVYEALDNVTVPSIVATTRLASMLLSEDHFTVTGLPSSAEEALPQTATEISSPRETVFIPNETLTTHSETSTTEDIPSETSTAILSSTHKISSITMELEYPPTTVGTNLKDDDETLTTTALFTNMGVKEEGFISTSIATEPTTILTTNIYTSDSPSVNSFNFTGNLSNSQSEETFTTEQNSAIEACENASMYRCFGGECVEHSSVCNGKPDCSDGSDEWNCDCGSWNNTSEVSPSLVLLFDKYNGKGCSASILSSSWLAVSVRCLDEGTSSIWNASNWAVEKNVTDGAVITASRRMNIFQNDSTKSECPEAGIALIELTHPLNDAIAVCVPQVPVFGPHCVIAGWKRNENSSAYDSYQLSISLNERHSACNATTEAFCQSQVTPQNFDAGALLLCKGHRNHWELRGLVQGCYVEETVSAYSDIYSRKQWISDVIS